MTKSMTKQQKRIEPQFRKRKKTLSQSTKIWALLDHEANKLRLNRSQMQERINTKYFATNEDAVLAEYHQKKIELAVLNQQLQNIKERKKLEVE